MSVHASSAARQRVAYALTRPAAGIIIFLVIVSAVMATQYSTFLTVSNWFDIISQIVVIMILAVAMTLVMIGGGIDLSVGAILGLSGGVDAWLLNHNAPLLVAFLGTLGAGLLLGLINGLVITRLRIPPFVATLAMLGAAGGILFVWTNGIPFLINESDAYRTIAGLNMVVWQITVPMIIVVALGLAASALLRYTRFGRHLRATGSSEDTARLSGVKVDRIKLKMYALSGLLAGLGAILLVGRLSTVEPTTGSDYEISAIAAAVMGGAALTGGRGSVLGALIGAVTLSVIQNVINLVNINSAWDTVITGVIILLAVLVDKFVTTIAIREVTRPPVGAAEPAAV